MKKIKKFCKNPGVFFRDYFNKNYPIIRNEIRCSEMEEQILIQHDYILDNLMPVDYPIDIVFTWVNDSDVNWSNKYNYYKGSIDLTGLGNYAIDNARFSNHDELYYSIKSIKKNIPWVRMIYIITDGQTPHWFMEDNGIEIIDHKDIIPVKYLPTFNSHVIEAHLHLIPGLSENFIYFNDDVFVARHLSAGHFFKSNGIASLFLSRKSLREMRERGVNTPTLSASLSGAKIFSEDFGITIDAPLVHTYVPLKRSYFKMAWELYDERINHFLINKFRTNNDMNLATFFVPWLMYVKGQSVPERDICYYFNIRSRAAKTYYKALRNAKNLDALPHSFCANDFNSNNIQLINYNQILKNELSFHFDDE